MLGALLAILHPCYNPTFSFFLIIDVSPSKTKMNKKGDKGSPYLKPLCAMIGPSTSAPTNTLCLTDLKHSITKEIYLLLNPKVTNIFSKKSPLKLIKSFSYMNFHSSHSINSFLLPVKPVNYFICHHDIICNQSPPNKSTLRLINNIRQNNSKTIGNHL